MLTVTDAYHIKRYKIFVEFNNNKRGEVDLEDFIISGKIQPFKELKDIEKFKHFKVDYTIQWDNGLDIAPEYLYFKAFENEANLQQLFKEWGYI